MGATIANYSDMKTVAYAELWSADSFIIVANDWWPQVSLPSEDKGDERGIGGDVRYKIDVPARCWIIWEGTSDGRRVLQVQRAADGQPLDEPPGASFLPIERGVNVISFGAEPRLPEEPPEEPGGEEPPEEPRPEPEPGPPAEMPKPQFITIFVGGSGQQTTPIVHWRRLGEKGTDSEFWELVMVIRGDHYDKLWKGLEENLMEAIGDCQTNHLRS